MKNVSIAILLTLVLLMNVAVVFGADAAAGKDLYMKKCKVCHGVDGTPSAALQKANPDLKAFSSTEFQALKDADIKKKITDLPKHKMSARGLAEADLDNLVAFLRTLKK
jgi:cytochrome c553